MVGRCVDVKGAVTGDGRELVGVVPEGAKYNRLGGRSIPVHVERHCFGRKSKGVWLIREIDAFGGKGKAFSRCANEARGGSESWVLEAQAAVSVGRIEMVVEWAGTSGMLRMDKRVLVIRFPKEVVNGLVQSMMRPHVCNGEDACE